MNISDYAGETCEGCIYYYGNCNNPDFIPVPHVNRLKPACEKFKPSLECRMVRAMEEQARNSAYQTSVLKEIDDTLSLKWR